MLQIFLKIIFSVVIISLLLNKVDFNSLMPLFKKISIGWSLLSILFAWLSLFAIAIRWQQVLSSMKHNNVNYKTLVRLVFVGFFFNQGLPSTIGGDIYRVYALKNIIERKLVLNSVLNDRLFGVMAMTVLCIATIPLQWTTIKGTPLLKIIIFSSFLVIAGTLFILLFHKLPIKIHKKLSFINNISSDSYQVWRKDGLKILLIALVSMLLCIYPFYFIAIDLKIKLSMLQITSIVPLAFLIGSLPISFAGWGVREGILVFTLDCYGIIAEQALAISIIFGILQLLAAIPGLFIYLISKSAVVRD